jgi:mRNA interferase MazF
MNDNLQTVIVAPMTTKSHDYPSRIKVDFQNKTGWIVLDQMIIIDKSRLTRKLGEVDKKTVQKVRAVIKEMLVD